MRAANPRASRPVTPPATGAPASSLIEHRSGDAVWITRPEFEQAGRTAGLPDPAVVERWLAIGPSRDGDTSGRGPTRIESWPAGDRRLHVRRVLHGGWLAPIWRGRVAGLARTRAELALSDTLHRTGAPVAEPAFLLGRRRRGLWRVAFCSVHIDDAIDAIAFLRSEPDTDRVSEAGRRAGEAARALADLGVAHDDLHLGNLLLREEADGLRAWVIDLDGARRGSSGGAKDGQREVARLRRSLVRRRIDPSLGERFVEAFRSGYASGAVKRP